MDFIGNKTENEFQCWPRVKVSIDKNARNDRNWQKWQKLTKMIEMTKMTELTKMTEMTKKSKVDGNQQQQIIDF